MLDIKADKTNTQSHEMTGKCPFGGDRVGGALGTPPTLSDWYPNRLKVEQLHANGPQANPLADFDYAQAFSKIDYDALKRDIKAFLTSSVDWWPSDYGNYGPQMIRMAWHAAGTYRIADGRGGAGEALQRFAPISSWWDNGNTDKSRRLIWPIKQKHGSALSWGDLMVLTGNCALEIMGFPTYGKKIKGKKRHILVDTQGLLMHAIVHSADIQDRDGGELLIATLFGFYPFLLKLYADGGYQGPQFQQAVKKILCRLNLEIVKRSDQAKRFVVLPKRWIVERTFAWLGRCRRLAKDWECLNRKALAFLKLASIRLMLRKLCNPS